MEITIFFAVTIGFIVFILFFGKTYYMSVESFENQLSVYKGIEFQKGVPLKIEIGPSKKNGIRQVICFDKNEKKFGISITKDSQIRFTKKDGKRQQVYFDTIFILDSKVHGSKSHLVRFPIEPIDLHDIVKIELQFRNSRKEEIV